MIVCRSSMLSRFINGVLRRRPGLLGLDQLIGGTFSCRKVATDPWYIFNRPRVVQFGWPPKSQECDRGRYWLVGCLKVSTFRFRRHNGGLKASHCSGSGCDATGTRCPFHFGIRF
jgi:hypothetical protein